MITLACPACGKHGTAPDEMAGHTARCPGCSATFTVPLAFPLPVATPAAPPRAPMPPLPAPRAPRPSRAGQDDDEDDRPPRRRKMSVGDMGAFLATAMRMPVWLLAGGELFSLWVSYPGVMRQAQSAFQESAGASMGIYHVAITVGLAIAGDRLLSLVATLLRMNEATKVP